MPFQDQTLVCQQCGGEFIFSAAQQERFAQRGFNHPPKLCKPCYDAKRRTEGPRQPQRRPRPAEMGEYRSPAFRDSAPEHRGGGGRGGPTRGPRRQGGGGPPSEYRSPGFQRRDDSGGREEYRSPAFREHARKHDDEYRSPAFREHESRDYQSEYRAPGFQDQRARHRDEQPLFQLTCSRCGNKSMVPFIPEEKEEPLCDDCYRAQRKAQKAPQPEVATAAAPSEEPHEEE